MSPRPAIKAEEPMKMFDDLSAALRSIVREMRTSVSIVRERNLSAQTQAANAVERWANGIDEALRRSEKAEASARCSKCGQEFNGIDAPAKVRDHACETNGGPRAQSGAVPNPGSDSPNTGRVVYHPGESVIDNRRRDEDGLCTRCGLEWEDERDTLEPHECPPGFTTPHAPFSAPPAETAPRDESQLRAFYEHLCDVLQGIDNGAHFHQAACENAAREQPERADALRAERDVHLRYRDKARAALASTHDTPGDEAERFSGSASPLVDLANALQSKAHDAERSLGESDNTMTSDFYRSRARAFREAETMVRATLATNPAPADPAHPIQLVLHCPECGLQHIDRDEWAARLHSRHLCERCEHEWVPRLATVGVAAIVERAQNVEMDLRYEEPDPADEPGIIIIESEDAGLDDGFVVDLSGETCYGTREDAERAQQQWALAIHRNVERSRHGYASAPAEPAEHPADESDRSKALRFDLDRVGIESRERESVELVELRAEVKRLRDAMHECSCEDMLREIVDGLEAEHRTHYSNAARDRSDRQSHTIAATFMAAIGTVRDRGGAYITRASAAAPAERVPRDKGLPPPGWEHYTFHDDNGVECEAMHLRRVHTVAPVQEAWRIYDSEHGYAPAPAVPSTPPRAFVDALLADLQEIENESSCRNAFRIARRALARRPEDHDQALDPSPANEVERHRKVASLLMAHMRTQGPATTVTPDAPPHNCVLTDAQRVELEDYRERERAFGARAEPARPHKLTWNGTEWVDERCGCRYHPDDDNGSHGGAPHLHLCEQHGDAQRSVSTKPQWFDNVVNQLLGARRKAQWRGAYDVWARIHFALVDMGITPPEPEEAETLRLRSLATEALHEGVTSAERYRALEQIADVGMGSLPSELRAALEFVLDLPSGTSDDILVRTAARARLAERAAATALTRDSAAVDPTLLQLCKEILSPGSELNRLVTAYASMEDGT